ncbi:MAG: NAD-dependent DNA ligase LigA, partial [Muribaculaceae bacterium]|nr:NAD-dependent DNA ligase LigA [Muribaculaceae bacterium]
NIDGIGEETAELLYASGLASTIGDIYDLSEEKLIGVGRIGEKTAKKIMKGIEDSKNVPFERVLYALSIPNVGETTAKRLARAVTNMDTLQNMELDQLSMIPDIGPIIAKNIYDFLREPINEKNINRLREAGVKMSVPEENLTPAGNALKGKTIVISGTFSHHSRDEYKDIIMSQGGKNAGSISKKTSFVLAGENMGPAKLQKCEQLGIPIISEDEFLKMI